MPKVLLEETGVWIELTFSETLLASKSSLYVVYPHIVSAHVQDEDAWTHVWSRLAGTGNPGFRMAGTFAFNGGLAFLDYSTGKNCLVIETKSEKYQTIIVQPEWDEDPASLADAINKKVAAV